MMRNYLDSRFVLSLPDISVGSWGIWRAGWPSLESPADQTRPVVAMDRPVPDRKARRHVVIDMSRGEPDPAWPADPFWRDKIRIAKQARALGQAVRAGSPTSFRPGPLDPEPSGLAAGSVFSPDRSG